MPDPESNCAKAGGLIHLAEDMRKGSEELVWPLGDQGLEYVQFPAGKLLGDEYWPCLKTGIVVARTEIEGAGLPQRW